MKTNLIFLCILLLSLREAAAAREIYVSPTGKSSGDGADAAEAVDYPRFRTLLETPGNDADLYVYFAAGVYSVTTPFYVFDDSKYNGKTVVFSGPSLGAGHAVFDGAGTNNRLFDLPRDRSETSRFRITLHNLTIRNFTDHSNGNRLIDLDGSYQEVCLDRVTIRDCNNIRAQLMAVRFSSTSELDIYNSSIIWNNRGDQTLIDLREGKCFFYNNTFSNNTCDPRSGLLMGSGGESACNFRIFNNTFYNTGAVFLDFGGDYNERVRLINNLIAGSSRLRWYNTNKLTTAMKRNIFYDAAGKLSRVAAGHTGGVEIPDFFRYFSPVLTEYDAPGEQVHTLLRYHEASHPIAGRGGTASDLAAETGVAPQSLLDRDQLESLRPAAALSIGSVDVNAPVVHLRDTALLIACDRQQGVPASPVAVDLAALVLDLPTGQTVASFALPPEGGMAAIGHFTLSGATATFTPATGVYAGKHRFAYQMTTSGGSTAVGAIDVTLYSPGDLPAYTDPADFNTCFTFMGKVNFTSAYRFKSSKNGTERGQRLYGFSIPLVGDLNGDGFPEIIGLGQSQRANGGFDYLFETFNSIHIYDATGERKALLYFPDCGYTDAYSIGSTYHGSPSRLAIVDSDRDGTVEVIVAFPHNYYPDAANAQYRDRVVSFNLQYSDGNYSLVENWRSRTTYNEGNAQYQKPIPQIVDFDGDGVPEVLVYNKIYSAHATAGGALRDPLLTLETLGTDAFTGADDRATGGEDGDMNIPFEYIYDLDGDGIYDVAAGGKIYRILKNGSGAWSYQLITMPGVEDGRTGVADVTGDGIADVVVAKRTLESTSSGRVKITVWNPGFKITDATGKVIPNPAFDPAVSPTIRGEREIPLSNATTGNNSYVYIGDIDGREQTVGGRTFRLPEIAILGGHFNYSGTYAVPIHPNVAGMGIPTTSTSLSIYPRTGAEGVIAALTWDATEGLTPDERLKLSFILGHDDSSGNTGFSMFDFDNDGIQEICYRDERILRIIKAVKPYITESEASDSVILFKETVHSYTGFEYPVIADIDNDASAEMIVMGHEDGAGQAYGYIYALGNGTGEKFAPARKVWNQFMYDPFKINDDLTTPVGPAPNRLDTACTFRQEIRDESDHVYKIIDRYRPFNATLNQLPYFNVVQSASGQPLFDPVVFLSEAYFRMYSDTVEAQRPAIVTVSSNDYIEITIGNRQRAKTSISSAIPLSVYKNGRVSASTQVSCQPLSALSCASDGSSVGVRTILPGEEIRVRIPIPDNEDVYIVRLGDDSGGNPWVWRFGLNALTDGAPNPEQGTGVVRRSFRDCDWSDQWERVARFNVFDDAQTVQEYHSVTVNLLENDLLPDAFRNTLQLQSTHIVRSPLAGVLSFTGKGRGSRIKYTHTGAAELANGIDSFRYQFTFNDPTYGSVTRSATIYIYVLESVSDGFSACYGSEYRIRLIGKPKNQVQFAWYAAATGGAAIATGFTYPLGAIRGDSTLYIQPTFTVAPWQQIAFPRGALTIRPVTASAGAMATMRWTGHVNGNWKNPDNWVVVKQTNGTVYEAPAVGPPTSCTDVILSSDATHYPNLTDSVCCNRITMQDRAMLKNPHVLTYDSAQVEIRLTATERDRFVMWSAPLKGMYSGDYHFKNGPAPQWGDVYMNYFQQDHPGGGAAQANAFTATFGEVSEPLGLGKAFNLKVISTSETKEKQWIFPQPDASYSAAGVQQPLDRTGSSRFITDGVAMASDTTFTMAIAGDNANGNLVQVVNPYFAYLDVTQFLAGNADELYSTGYLIWNGQLNSSFIGVSTAPGMRYEITTLPGLTASGLIPPLQSFFVQKKNPAVSLPSVKMSPAWTTVASTGEGYKLRGIEAESGILRIKATQGDRSSYAVLHYDPSASPEFNGDEDVQTLFFDEIPLTLYSLTLGRKALSIGTSGDFESRTTDLGLRIRDGGEVKLAFSGLSTFGHTVYLIDREKNTEINLNESPEYTFTVTKPSGVKIMELDRRFSLRMIYTGNGLADIPPVAPSKWTAAAQGDELCVRTQSGELLHGIQVYDLGGALLYGSTAESNTYRIRVNRGRIYVVRVRTGDGGEEAQKVPVK